MKRVNQIIKHPDYMDALKQVKKYEASRIFCRHQVEHFLDVARIAYILNLEEYRFDAGGALTVSMKWFSVDAEGVKKELVLAKSSDRDQDYYNSKFTTSQT